MNTRGGPLRESLRPRRCRSRGCGSWGRSSSPLYCALREEDEEHKGPRGTRKDGIQSVEEAAMPRKPGADVLDSQVALDERFGEITQRAGGHHGEPEDQPDPPGLLDHEQ